MFRYQRQIVIIQICIYVNLSHHIPAQHYKRNYRLTELHMVIVHNLTSSKKSSKKLNTVLDKVK
jgi:transcriptional regulator of NAD metabolism